MRVIIRDPVIFCSEVNDIIIIILFCLQIKMTSSIISITRSA